MEAAIRDLYYSVRQVAEHAGAAALAAARRVKQSLEDRRKKVVVMLTGGNIDASQYARIISGGKG
jgi:threonine dehydratase